MYLSVIYSMVMFADQPEYPMPDMQDIAVGKVKHEVYMTGGILLIVIELNFHLKDLQDHFPPVFLDLSCECCPYLMPIMDWD